MLLHVANNIYIKRERPYASETPLGIITFRSERLMSHSDSINSWGFRTPCLNYVVLKVQYSRISEFLAMYSDRLYRVLYCCYERRRTTTSQ